MKHHPVKKFTIKQTIKYLNKTWRDQVCERCGEKSWNISECLTYPSKENPPKYPINFSNFAPTIKASCRNCKNCKYLNHNLVSLVKTLKEKWNG